MLREDSLIETIAGLAMGDLRSWVERGWVQPERRDGGRYYREIDVARVRLIFEIKEDLNVGAADVPLVLSLIDQIHGLRGQLKRLATAIDDQPEQVKRRILGHV